MSAQSPEVRATIIGGVLHAVAETPDSVAYGALFERIRASTGFAEEEVGEAIMHATSILVLSGLLSCSHYDTGLGEIAYTSDTRISAGPRLLAYVWREDLPRGDDAEA